MLRAQRQTSVVMAKMNSIIAMLRLCLGIRAVLTTDDATR